MGWASALVTGKAVLQLIRERVTPQRLSSGFWPSRFNCRLVKMALCQQGKGSSWICKSQ